MELTTNLDNMTLWSIVRAAPLAVQLVMALLLFLVLLVLDVDL